MTVILIHGLVHGEKSPYDGQYLVEYDPDQVGRRKWERILGCRLRTTSEKEDAAHYSDAAEAMKVWTRVSERDPVRWDGKPNRPLSAFTIEVMSE